MPIANIHVSVRAFPIRLGTTQGAHYHHFFFSISIGSLNQCNQIKKRIKDNQIEKEEVKCLLFAAPSKRHLRRLLRCREC